MTYNIPIKILDRRGYTPTTGPPTAVEGRVLVPRPEIEDQSYRCAEDERLVLGYDGVIYIQRPPRTGEKLRGRGGQVE